MVAKSGCSWQVVGVTLAFLTTGSCGDSVSGPGYVPEQLAGTVVGQITEVGENLTGLGPPPGVIEILVEELPEPTDGSCPATFIAVPPTADISIWRRSEEVRSGTLVDLRIGTIVRVFLEDGPCFGSCPGICGARSVQAFQN